MTIPDIITHLRAEQAILEAAIRELETLARLHAAVPDAAKRRGRKSMGHEERQEVSRRMKAFWARQRKGA